MSKEQRGKRLKAAREAHGLTQTQVARAVLGSERYQTVSEWERGTREPTADELTALRDLLDFDWADYYGGPGPSVPEPGARYGPDLDPTFIHEMEVFDDPDTVVRGDLHAGLGTRVYMILDKARLHGWGRDELLEALGRIRTWATEAEAEILRLHAELRRRDREDDGGGDP